jgi:hypothetical protein
MYNKSIRETFFVYSFLLYLLGIYYSTLYTYWCIIYVEEEQFMYMYKHYDTLVVNILQSLVINILQ